MLLFQIKQLKPPDSKTPTLNQRHVGQVSTADAPSTKGKDAAGPAAATAADNAACAVSAADK